MTRAGVRLLALLLALVGAVQVVAGAYPLAKGWLAMQLIRASYAREPGARPWPGADFRVVARLGVPRLGVNQLVLDDASGRTLAFGPGLIQPGADAGLLLSAHRDSHFAWLRELRHGDVLHYERGGRIERFAVTSFDVVDRRMASLSMPMADTMVLTTCWPFEALGAGGDLRLVVSAVALARRDRNVTQTAAIGRTQPSAALPAGDEAHGG